ncbi:MAG: hypothetical protein IKV54_06255 [Clostridia bacterium]|nr:hypothetical protein [Clostridia bacterium]
MNEHDKIIEALWELGEDETPEGELAAHLESCPDCAEEYKRIKEIKASLRDSAEPVPPELEERVMKVVTAEPRKKKSFYIPIGTISAAAVILLVFTLGSGSFSQKASDMMSSLSGGMHEAEDADKYCPEAPTEDNMDIGTPSYPIDKPDSFYPENEMLPDASINADPFGAVDSVRPPDAGRVTLIYKVQKEYLDKVRSLLGADTSESYINGMTVIVIGYTEQLAERIEELSEARYTRDADQPVKYFAVVVAE